MTPAQVRAARESLKLSLKSFGAMLGYEGSGLAQQAHRLEENPNSTQYRRVREPQRRLIEAYLAGYRPADWPKQKS